MRKHYFWLIATCLLASSVSYAQKYPLGKGALRSGGGFNFTQIDDPEGKAYRISVNPNLGYFLFDELLLGLNVNYSGVIGPSTYNANLRVSPQVRYYYSFSESFFLIGDVYYNVDRQLRVNGGSATLTDNSSFSFGPGVDYFLSRRISVEGVLVYQAYLTHETGNFNKLSFNVGFNIRLPIKRSDRLNMLPPDQKSSSDLEFEIYDLPEDDF